MMQLKDRNLKSMIQSAERLTGLSVVESTILLCSKVDGPIFSEVDELCVTLSQRARYVV